MASSGSFSGSIHSGHYVLRVDWSQAKNISANTSNITANIYLVNDYNLNVGARTDNVCTIDGSAITFNSPAVRTTGTHLLNTVTKTVSHNSDGTKSLTISAVFYIRATISGTYYNSITASATITLDSIARASTVSATSVNMGATSAISIARASSAFTHTLTYTFGSASGTIATKTTATSLSWTPPMTLANQIPNSVSGTCTITCSTYNGNTLIGSKSCTLTLSVPSSVRPTVTALLGSRVDGDVPSSWGIYVQSKSKCSLSIYSPSGSYGSTIKSYSISGGGYSATASTMTTGFLNYSGSITFTATVTDSRGRVSAPVTLTITVYPYSSPFFNGYSTYRATSDGTYSDSGTCVSALARYGYYSCNGKNSVYCYAFYRQSGTSQWTYGGSVLSGEQLVFGGGNITTDYSWEIMYQLSDSFTTVSIVDTIPTASVVMDFKRGGYGVAVGKVAEDSFCFEVSENWNVKVYGMLLGAYIRFVAGAASSSQIAFAQCSTDAATQLKVATSSSSFTLTAGTIVAVKFTNTNAYNMPQLNVNNTGAKYIVSYANYIPAPYSWKPGQTVLFVYDGTFYVGIDQSTATTAYYGITKLYGGVDSTSVDLAATASAVKAAYDRNSWPSISLTSPLAIAYGGTGSTYAAGARANLGITATSLYWGTLTTGSTTFSLNYKVFVIIGQPSSSSARAAVCIPASVISTAAVAYQFADESNYYSFNLSYSGSTVTLAFKGRSSTGQILRIFGIN